MQPNRGLFSEILDPHVMALELLALQNPFIELILP